MSPSRINKTPHNFTNVGVTLSKYFGDKDNCSFFYEKRKSGLTPLKNLDYKELYEKCRENVYNEA